MNYVILGGQKLEQKKGVHFCNIKHVFTCLILILEPDASSLIFSKRRDLTGKGFNKEGSRLT